MIEWLNHYGLLGIFMLAIMEFIFLPIPAETLLIPQIILNPGSLTVSTLPCTLGSAIGALVGHRIGLVGGKKVLLKFFSRGKK